LPILEDTSLADVTDADLPFLETSTRQLGDQLRASLDPAKLATVPEVGLSQNAFYGLLRASHLETRDLLKLEQRSHTSDG
jgi:hypothetical protein